MALFDPKNVQLVIRTYLMHFSSGGREGGRWGRVELLANEVARLRLIMLNRNVEVASG